LDGDWYDSTRDILSYLFDSVSVGAPLQVDDYGYWDGCKRAILEFQQERGLAFQINEIDGTGVWFLRGRVETGVNVAGKVLLNIGCGKRVHEDWVNLDLVAQLPGVIAHDIRNGLPFPDASFSVVYHSHVLEHIRRSAAPVFIRECYRVLAPGGILRVVVPDLETIARLYLKNLEGAIAGDADAALRYEWMLLELFDQMVRDESGGEVLKYWKKHPMPAESFVIERMGSEVKNYLETLKNNTSIAAARPSREPSIEEQIEFRASGEVHRWMYDRWSLGRLLEECGFNDITVCTASESRIHGFNAYPLDCEENGSPRKPDSLFVEAQKPLP
jgi:predicted SAM-dependent methyltransferase